MPTSIAEVLAHYKLSETVSLARLRSRTNQNYLLTTSDGCYVLRSSHRSRSTASLIFEHRLLCYLEGRGFPAVAPLPSRELKTWVEHDDELWTLCRYVPGEQLNRAHLPHLTGAARVLASYHRLAHRFESSDEQRAGMRNIEQWLQSTVETSLRPRRAEEPAIEQARNSLLENVDRLSRALTSCDIAQLPKVVIHGDFSRRNILFQQDQLVAVLDFDGCHFEIRAMDLAIALKNICRGQDKHSQPDMSKVSAFMAAYKAEEPLTDGELAAIPTLLQAHRLRSLMARYERLVVTQRPKKGRTEKFLSEVERLCWLNSHRNEIVDALHVQRTSL